MIYLCILCTGSKPMKLGSIFLGRWITSLKNFILAFCPQVVGCPPAMGYSFAAGTTDGPGVFPFSQSIVMANPLWNTIRNLIYGPSERQKTCHYPKPILLTTGEVRRQYLTKPTTVSAYKVVPTHRIHQFVCCVSTSIKYF